MRKLRLIATFYQSYAFASLLVTLFCLLRFYSIGIKPFAVLFWFKIATMAIFMYFIDVYKRDEFYYYKNLGLSKVVLWVSTLVFDFILFLVLISIALMIR